MDWHNSTLITGDVGDYAAKLKSQDGAEIQVHGSAGLIQTLLEGDLIDEFRIWVFPLVIGTGEPTEAEIERRRRLADGRFRPDARDRPVPLTGLPGRYSFGGWSTDGSRR